MSMEDVYIVGDIVKVVHRFSLPDVDESESLGYGVMPLPRVSRATTSVDEEDLCNCHKVQVNKGSHIIPSIFSSTTRLIFARQG